MEWIIPVAFFLAAAAIPIAWFITESARRRQLIEVVKAAVERGAGPEDIERLLKVIEGERPKPDPLITLKWALFLMIVGLPITLAGGAAENPGIAGLGGLMFLIGLALWVVYLVGRRAARARERQALGQTSSTRPSPPPSVQ